MSDTGRDNRRNVDRRALIRAHTEAVGALSGQKPCDFFEPAGDILVQTIGHVSRPFPSIRHKSKGDTAAPDRTAYCN